MVLIEKVTVTGSTRTEAKGKGKEPAWIGKTE